MPTNAGGWRSWAPLAPAGRLRVRTADTADAIVEELLASNLAARDPDDDIAIVVVRHRG